MNSPLTLSAPQIKMMLPPRPVDAHKGLNGHVLVLAGSRGMSGAAALCSRGALRIGAGLVTVAIVSSEHTVVTEQLPEALTLPLPETADGILTENALPVLRDYFEKRKINVLAIGPGLSVCAAVGRVIKTLLKEWDKPLVLDADGLNNVNLRDLRNHPGLMITPHVGELTRLMRSEASIVKQEPVRCAEKVARECSMICVLKGHPTIISDGKKNCSESHRKCGNGDGGDGRHPDRGDRGPSGSRTLALGRRLRGRLSPWPGRGPRADVRPRLAGQRCRRSVAGGAFQDRSQVTC